ncbi:preprotein translocase subunit YajC [Anaerotignum lactatifermentans]|uniref:Preprotein translocase subunit YajC n=1 Tax=Anaerotignum lactatifermentans TaxID=160404 RepID=A0ABS2G7T8_9FIRM|nr:preprotein translocase subunit YajC [Anaerotignum lactatifermentans]MBM6829216.1 preprotein translocase subunit YajC [Anaerotignum lactatifermentans]MBM6877544.1 preprotein translocase subunit YajC [Anaerotignum lactatifermentans]MBM6950794.1 preprotein translocase subunit YajC [Anaerotignum lactatifermentans]
MNEWMRFLLDSSTVITPTGSETQAAAETTSSGLFGGFLSGSNGFTIVIVYVIALVVIMYFLSFRPTQKREKALAEQRNAIQIGDMVVTNSGLYGKVVDMTYDCFIIEFGLNKGVRVPVARGEVYGKREPNMTNEAPPEEEKPKKKGLFRRG